MLLVSRQKFRRVVQWTKSLLPPAMGLVTPIQAPIMSGLHSRQR
ncbi:hypothetical protein RSOL_120370 [Rhizoctonia solani AG-3 Rhs1AP]|uniref:Uncharacterized protein n=1 Tax=Rhizoctonia solani AG-3 Rhs1AP TaxID=1086054 RepID=X8J0M8_9AGAM|nr:hypothetical protein RSOL_120370 [Rhizoctonia solani AG-3 Rhs1AP]